MLKGNIFFVFIQNYITGEECCLMECDAAWSSRDLDMASHLHFDCCEKLEYHITLVFYYYMKHIIHMAGKNIQAVSEGIGEEMCHGGDSETAGRKAVEKVG
jgi:hypothetical protein